MTDFNQKYIFLKSFLGLPELSAEQLFFLNFAQVIKEYCRGVFVFVLLQIFYHSKVWCGASRPEALQSKLKTAVHAPGKYRWGNNGHGNNGLATMVMATMAMATMAMATMAMTTMIMAKMVIL